MKDKVLQSRLTTLSALITAMQPNPPGVFICTSGVGAYGEDDSKIFNEFSTPATGSFFLKQVADEVEHLCVTRMKQELPNTRVVLLRLGVVLDPSGGALHKMLIPFKFGLGGPLGSGEQIFPWVSRRDVVRAVQFVAEKEHIQGPVNVVAPDFTSQKRFAQALGKALHRPAIIPLPEAVLNLVFTKEAARAMFLASIKVEPKVLLDADFKFNDVNIEVFLKDVLK